jgi:hypothetical protein
MNDPADVCLINAHPESDLRSCKAEDSPEKRVSLAYRRYHDWNLASLPILQRLGLGCTLGVVHCSTNASLT